MKSSRPSSEAKNKSSSPPRPDSSRSPRAEAGGRAHKVFGFNVIAHASGNFGLAVAARNTLRMLSARGERACVLDVDAGGGRFGHDLIYRPLECAERPLPWGVNLFHINPPDAILLGTDQPRAVSLSGRLNAAVPFWELPSLPRRDWAAMLDAVDLVLAPSGYIRSVVERSCPAARVRHYPQAVFLPENVSADRSVWGLPGGAFVVFFGMDVSSDVERKNPLAAFEAFREAFPPGGAADAVLAVKFNNAGVAPRFERDGADLVARFSSDPRVRIFTGNLPYRDAVGLNAACDVCLSLHRAEGLGLNLMEAMSLGKPVVATGWSGNTDFMTAENSCPVAFRMVRVRTDHPSYKNSADEVEQEWADADVGDAARRLRALYENAELRRAIGQAARVRMDQARAGFLRGEWVDDLRREFESGAAGSPDHARRAARLKAVLKPGWKRSVRRHVGNLLRRLRLRT